MGKVEKKILEKVSQIHDLCLEINNRDDLEDGKPVIDFENCWHVYAVYIKIFESWHEERIRPDKRMIAYMDKEDAEHELNEMIAYLEELKEKSERRSDNCGLY